MFKIIVIVLKYSHIHVQNNCYSPQIWSYACSNFFFTQHSISKTCPSSGGVRGVRTNPLFEIFFINYSIKKNHPRNPRLIGYARTPFSKPDDGPVKGGTVLNRPHFIRMTWTPKSNSDLYPHDCADERATVCDKFVFIGGRGCRELALGMSPRCNGGRGVEGFLGLLLRVHLSAVATLSNVFGKSRVRPADLAGLLSTLK